MVYCSVSVDCQVTNQCLWPQVIVALSSDNGTAITPSAHAALSLQNLYNLSLRHWEPSIFSGLLASFNPLDFSPATRARTFLDEQNNQPIVPMVSGSFGVATPQKELDLSQWTNFDWNSTSQGTGLTPYINGPSAGSSALANELLLGGLSRDEDQIRGIDEILAQMEENRATAEIKAALSAMPEPPAEKARPVSAPHQMPTPDTDRSDVQSEGQAGSTPSDTRKASFTLTPPSSHDSPIAIAKSKLPAGVPSGQSALARPGKGLKSAAVSANQLMTPPDSSQNVPRISTTGQSGKKTHQLSLAMPTTAFVPPPPMCMFFSPAFHDLQNGKVGVWKGDLDIRGVGGGKFSILIVGEETTGHLW